MRKFFVWLWKCADTAGTATDIFQWSTAAVAGIGVFFSGYLTAAAMPYTITAAILAAGGIVFLWRQGIEATRQRPFVSLAETRTDHQGEGVQHTFLFRNATAQPSYDLTITFGSCPPNEPDKLILNESEEGPFRIGPGPQEFTYRAHHGKYPQWVYVALAYAASAGGKTFTDHFYFEHTANSDRGIVKSCGRAGRLN
jgi:hypothetical protein